MKQVVRGKVAPFRLVSGLIESWKTYEVRGGKHRSCSNNKCNCRLEKGQIFLHITIYVPGTNKRTYLFFCSDRCWAEHKQDNFSSEFMQRSVA